MSGGPRWSGKGRVLGIPCKVGNCDGMIMWAVTDQGKRMPVDAYSAGIEGGDLAVWRAGGKAWGELRARVLSAADPEPHPGEEILGTSHWGTCADAEAVKAARRAEGRCPACNHRAHVGECAHQGPVECRQVTLDDGQGGKTTARVRGRFPCGCTEVTPPGRRAATQETLR